LWTGSGPRSKRTAGRLSRLITLWSRSHFYFFFLLKTNVPTSTTSILCNHYL
jgi:hypothetical protein